METVEEYKPLNIDIGFSILTDSNGTRFLTWKNGRYKFPIGPMGYIPKSGLFFYDILQSIVQNKSVLDLGCGEMGIISLFSLINNAKNVTAVDIDNNCISWLEHIKKENNLHNLTILESDMFQNVHDKFDIIVSNPPIMPMEHISDDNVHDSGGIDGRFYLTTIMQSALNYLTSKGCLFLSAFSFLGTDIVTGNQISLKEYALQTGYKSFEIVKKVIKPLAKDSVTYRQLPYIRKIYPKMPVLEYHGRPAVEFQILRIEK